MLEQKTTVTITFAGLALFCFKGERNDNSEKTYSEFQAAILQCPKHELVIDALEIALDPKTGEQIGSKLLSHSLNKKQNIKITAEKPKTERVKRHENRGVEFDLERDLGDPKDFRWIVDLEGEKFDNQKLQLRPHPSVASPKQLGPLITVSSGVVYTAKRSDEKFALISMNNSARQPRLLGRIAHKIALDIVCDDRNGGAVRLSNAGSGNALPPLKAEPNKRYLIAFDNVCPPSEELREGTDFRFIFDAASNQTGERFDLQRVVENGGRGNIEAGLPGHSDFSLDSEPFVCMGGLLSLTDGFPDMFA